MAVLRFSVFFCIFSNALVVLGRPAPTIQGYGNKIIVTASDLSLQPFDDGPAISLNDMDSSITSINQQIDGIKSTASATDISVRASASVLSGRVTNLEAFNSTQATLNITNLAVQQELLAQGQDVINDRINKLQGVVDELSEQVKTKASQLDLNALINEVVANSSSALQAFTICHAKGGTLSNGQCSKRQQYIKAFTCVGQTIQKFTVDAGVDSVHMQVWGGGGAGSAWNTGGAGGYSVGDRKVNQGDVMSVLVACSQPAGEVCDGACGKNYQPGWPGTQATFAASCGGGYSGVFQGDVTNPAQNIAIVIAGGGGGGGGGPQVFASHKGGAGGGALGQDGTINNGAQCNVGKGGSDEAGGAKGCLSNGGLTQMTDGAALLGGRGADGGSGGAGYYGGGGGSRGGNWLHAGGGGGSGYIGGLDNSSMHTGSFHQVFGGSLTPGNGYQAGVAVGGVGFVGGPGLIVMQWTKIELL